MVEQMGWRLEIVPTNEGPSGFHKIVNGVKVTLPISYDRVSRLYKMHYAMGSSIEDAKATADKITIFSEGGQRAIRPGQGRTRGGTRHCRMFLMNETQMPAMDTVVDDDGTGHQPEEMDAEIPRSRGLISSKLKVLEIHRKLGHRGTCKECKVCRMLKPKRKMLKKALPELDAVAGRTWNMFHGFYLLATSVQIRTQVHGRGAMRGDRVHFPFSHGY